MTGGLVPSGTLLGSTIASRLLPKGLVIGIDAVGAVVGALGNGFWCVNGGLCWLPRAGCWGRKVLSSDIALCNGVVVIDQQTSLQVTRLRGIASIP